MAVLRSLDGYDPGWDKGEIQAAEESFLMELATLYPEKCKKGCTYSFS